jgi:hypothetical protein
MRDVPHVTARQAVSMASVVAGNETNGVLQRVMIDCITAWLSTATLPC